MNPFSAPASAFINHYMPPTRYAGSFADHEQSLWRAVITQALMDAASKSAKSEAKRARLEALEWLLSASPDFEDVCEHAGFNPNYVREQSQRALTRGFAWRLPAGKGWRTQARQKALSVTLN